MSSVTSYMGRRHRLVHDARDTSVPTLRVPLERKRSGKGILWVWRVIGIVAFMVYYRQFRPVDESCLFAYSVRGKSKIRSKTPGPFLAVNIHRHSKTKVPNVRKL